MKLQPLIHELGPLTVMAELMRTDGERWTREPEARRLLPALPAHLADEELTVGLRAALTAIPHLDRKQRIVVVGPELLLVEALGDLGFSSTVQVALDAQLADDVCGRIAGNVPPGLTAEFFRVPSRPAVLGPVDAVVITAGFRAGYRHVLIPDSSREIVNFYKAGYLGEIILLDPVGFSVFDRPDGWSVVDAPQTFTRVITPEPEWRVAQ